jgi:hypothetical protein
MSRTDVWDELVRAKISLSNFVLVFVIVTVVFGAVTCSFASRCEYWRNQADYWKDEHDRAEVSLDRLREEFTRLGQSLVKPRAYLDSVPQLRLVLPYISGLQEITIYSPVARRYFTMDAAGYGGYLDNPLGLPIGLVALPFHVQEGTPLTITVMFQGHWMSWDIIVGVDTTVA